MNGFLNFRYRDPYAGFRRNLVFGKVASLFNIPDL